MQMETQPEPESEWGELRGSAVLLYELHVTALWGHRLCPLCSISSLRPPAGRVGSWELVRAQVF